MKFPQRKQGQTMVEYIIIVVLIAITLITLIGFFGKAIGKKFSGATSAIDEDVGTQAQGAYQDMGDDGTAKLKRLDEAGNL